MAFHSGGRSDGKSGSNAGGSVGGQLATEPSIRCSLCAKPFKRGESKSFPFCSERCRRIDLGNWLNESYGLPVEDGEGLGVEELDEE